MPEQALLDNDVALKVASYALVVEMIAVTTVSGLPPAMLGVGRFVIQGRLKRASNIANVAGAKAAFEELLTVVALVEPNDEELELAADLETEANRCGLELDGGESQLLAMLAKRPYRLLITGDKRAIAAMAVVAPGVAASRIVCLEQLIVRIVDAVGFEAVRPRICIEPRVDRAITISFGCARRTVGRDDVMAGLTSYIRHLERNAPGVLMREFDVTATNPAG